MAEAKLPGFSKTPGRIFALDRRTTLLFGRDEAIAIASICGHVSMKALSMAIEWSGYPLRSCVVSGTSLNQNLQAKTQFACQPSACISGSVGSLCIRDMGIAILCLLKGLLCSVSPLALFSQESQNAPPTSGRVSVRLELPKNGYLPQQYGSREHAHKGDDQLDI